MALAAPRGICCVHDLSATPRGPELRDVPSRGLPCVLLLDSLRPQGATRKGVIPRLTLCCWFTKLSMVDGCWVSSGRRHCDAQLSIAALQGLRSNRRTAPAAVTRPSFTPYLFLSFHTTGYIGNRPFSQTQTIAAVPALWSADCASKLAGLLLTSIFSSSISSSHRTYFISHTLSSLTHSYWS